MYWETWLYEESASGNAIVEPYNGTSAVLFIPLALLWIWKTRFQWKTHGILGVSSIILLIGGLGGTAYHYFRLYPLFLFMDWVPIMVLCLMAAIYFMLFVWQRWWIALLVVVGMFGGSALIFQTGWVSPSLAVSLNYVIMALSVLLPLLAVLLKTKFNKAGLVIGAVISFVLAIIFRINDLEVWLPMGTHFLWHTFGASAAAFMFAYLNQLVSFRVQQK